MSSLTLGSRVGPYEVVAAIGAGGMGEVFRARDRTLDRDVALKILPAAWADDPERRSRFAREARLLAALNHPHIAQVYGVEDSIAGPAIAMEFVEGRTLKALLQAGAIGRRAATDLAREVAMALDAAHEKGIVHRDLKPANIVVTPEGSAKVLDFGLAKLWTDESGQDGMTVTSDGLTVQGAVLGTPAYMSPEQARGQPVDRRTDIWAFGCVLYELLAGRPAFYAPTVSDTLAAILERDPDWQALPADTPLGVRQLILRCLEKDRRRRLRDIGDALHDLAGSSSDVSPDGARSGIVASSAVPVPRSRALTAVLAVATVVLSATTLWLLLADRAATSVGGGAGPIRFALPPPAGVQYGSLLPRLEALTMELAPDGSSLAFIATRQGRSEVWIRPLGDENARAVDGTEGAVSVFWSPDAKALAFFASGQLKRVDLAGGAPVKICDVPRNVGLVGTWSASGDILFASVSGASISRVAAAGGSPTVVVAGSGEGEPTRRVLWPRFLPDGRRFLYTALHNESRGEVVLVRPDGSSVELVAAESLAQWVDPDWLLYVREGTLVAQRVDLDAGRVVGDPVSLIGLVGHSVVTGWSAFSASLNGTLVAQSQLDKSRMIWFDRAGREAGVVSTPGGYNTLRLSPDGSALAFSRMRPELGTYDLWTADLGRPSETRLTAAPGMEVGETWVPGGRTMVFASGQGAPPNLFARDLATGAERRLLSSPRFQWPEDISPDGSLVGYRERTERGDWDLLTFPLSAPDQVTPLLATPSSEISLQFAPNGRSIAFTSDVSTRSEVYLSPFPVNGASPTPVSSAGGIWPRWRRDGRELFFLSEGQLIVVPIDATGVPGAPRPLFSTAGWLSYDVTPDGQRFIAVVLQVSERDQPLTVIVGWPLAAGR